MLLWCISEGVHENKKSTDCHQPGCREPGRAATISGVLRALEGQHLLQGCREPGYSLGGPPPPAGVLRVWEGHLSWACFCCDNLPLLCQHGLSTSFSTVCLTALLLWPLLRRCCLSTKSQFTESALWYSHSRKVLCSDGVILWSRAHAYALCVTCQWLSHPFKNTLKRKRT